MDKKILIQLIEKKGFEVKGKTKDNWKICYEVKSLNEKYSISISGIKKKNIIQSILSVVEYWKYMGLEDIKSKKAQKEIENIISKMKKIIGEINGKHDREVKE